MLAIGTKFTCGSAPWTGRRHRPNMGKRLAGTTLAFWTLHIGIPGRLLISHERIFLSDPLIGEARSCWILTRYGRSVLAIDAPRSLPGTILVSVMKS